MRVKRYFEPYQEKAIQEFQNPCIASWLEVSGFPSRMERWFIQARDEAFKSDFYAAKVGCVIVYKKHCISSGHNQLKTDPFQKIYNQKYREWTKEAEFSKTCGHTLHAEIDALKNVSYPVSQKINWNKVEVYVFRVALGIDGHSGLALPCPACAHALSDVGIQKVFYTTGRLDKPFGFCEL